MSTGRWNSAVAAMALVLCLGAIGYRLLANDPVAIAETRIAEIEALPPGRIKPLPAMPPEPASIGFQVKTGQDPFATPRHRE
ncbi:MAG: hypothetical protein KDH88_18280 [Chromatiales bacterium]|nr:hypothetical protein [Chromatiales bacterium]